MNMSEGLSKVNNQHWGRIMTVPNCLSLARLCCAAVFFVFGLKNQWVLAFWFFVGGAATDLVDGTLARLLHQKSQLGSFLDPLADKVMMWLSVVVLMLKSYLPLWLLVLVFARDLLILYGLIRYKLRNIHIEYKPTVISKIATLLFIITVSIALLKPLALEGHGPFSLQGIEKVFPYFLYPAGLLIFMTLIQYYIIGLRILKTGTREPRDT